MFPSQAQLYAQGPPPTYDQALTHPAIMSQQVIDCYKNSQNDNKTDSLLDVPTSDDVCCSWLPRISWLSDVHTNAVLSIARCLLISNATDAT